MKKFFPLLLAPLLLFSKPSSYEDFNGLMGNQTSHWRFVGQPKDLEFLEKAHALYKKNYQAQFSENALYKIPPVVHFIWLGPRAFPPESVENIRTWIAQNPGWKVKFWTDREREAPCAGVEMILVKDFYFAKLKRCYEESNNWGEKSDLLRYEILFKEGGVYADHDANCLRPFAKMHKGFDFFCCLETPHEPFVGRNITCGNGLLGARPRHPVVEEVLNLISKRWETIGEEWRGKDDYSKAEIVMRRTYIALTDAVLKACDASANTDIILPAAYFFSKTGIPSLYSQHFYATAWDESRSKPSFLEKNTLKQLGKLYHKNRQLGQLTIALIGINLLGLGYFLWRKK